MMVLEEERTLLIDLKSPIQIDAVFSWPRIREARFEANAECCPRNSLLTGRKKLQLLLLWAVIKRILRAAFNGNSGMPQENRMLPSSVLLQVFEKINPNRALAGSSESMMIPAGH